MSKKLRAKTGKMIDELFVLSVLIELMATDDADMPRLMRQSAEAVGRCHELLAPYRKPQWPAQ